MRVVAVDWSGRSRGAERHIWLAEAGRGEALARLESGRGRRALGEHLVEIASRDPRLVVGLDFSFSFPAWYMAERGFSSARQLWERLDEHAADALLASCEPPFFGRPGRRSTVAADRLLRETDRELRPTYHPGSVFKIGGAGAVGTASIRGMATLALLARAGFHIWPFDPPGWPLALEIYPRALTGPVVKTSPEARRRYLAERRFSLAPRHRSNAVASDDAFDAAVSALVMAGHRHELERLPTATSVLHRLEGRIWLPSDATAPPCR